MAFTGTSIAELNDTLPLGTDSKSFGDDNIREIKHVLKESFPNSPIGDKYEGTLGQLTDLAATTTIPRDMIIMWAGSQVTQTDGPEGWTICDGRARKSGGGNSPDFRGVFPFGAQADDQNAGLLPKSGDAGGNNEIDIRDFSTGNLHTYTTNGHSLTQAQLPAHHHSVAEAGIGTVNASAAKGIAASGGDYSLKESSSTIPNPGVGNSSEIGSNQSHTHNFTINGSNTTTGANIPAYLAIIFLIKD